MKAYDELISKIQSCRKCKLCETRHNVVIGEGILPNRVVLIGEAPGEDEDKTGRPFVGRAGQLLTDILEKGGHIPRSSVYIMNMVKCRPPENRNPSSDELSCCREYLEAQLLLLHPDIIVTLGNVPLKALLSVSEGITIMRGRWQAWRGVKLLPMFHPSYLLRNNDVSLKRATWQDVLSLKAAIEGRSE